jgi:pimeloyl-ACP methyl ester carboxylesterase
MTTADSTHHTIDNGGVALHVADDGDHTLPTVLLLHGITSCTTTWDWLVPRLTERYRVLRLDFRGHGRSDRAADTYQLPFYVSDAIAVCEQVAGRPCLVVGHSLGGGTAAALAQQRPDLVTAIVLEDPALMAAVDLDPANATALEDNTLLEGFALMRQMAPLLQAQQMTSEALADVLQAAPAPSGGTFGERIHRDGIVAMAAGILQMDPTVLDPVLERSMVPAYDPAVTITVPGLVLAADPSNPDAVVRQVDRDRLAAVSPLVEVRTVTGAGHLVHDEIATREVFATAALAFLDAHR